MTEQKKSKAPQMVFPTLSRREAEVLCHVSDGKINREISEILGISERTVEKHLESVYAKLGVKTRTAATAFFFKNGYASHGDMEAQRV